MTIKIKDCLIENCGTAIRAEGKVDLSVDGLICKNNNRDIDLEITGDSIVEIERFLAEGTKRESITIKEYDDSLSNVIATISKLPGLSADDRTMILDRLNQLVGKKDWPLLISILRHIRDNVKSIPSQVVVNLIVSGFLSLLK